MMDRVEKPEEQYAELYKQDGYVLRATAEVSIPWYKSRVKCGYTVESCPSGLDRAVLACMDRGVLQPSDIAFVLALKEPIVRAMLSDFLKNGMVEETKDGGYLLTDDGRALHERNAMVVSRSEEYYVYTNAISGEVTTEPETDFFDDRNMEGAIKLEVLVGLNEKAMRTNPKVIAQLETAHGIHVRQLKTGGSCQVILQKEIILFYVNPKKDIRFLIVDPLTGERDSLVGEALRVRYQKGLLLELLKAGETLLQIDREEKVIDSLSKTGAVFYRNKQIRELFKNVFHIAQKSIFFTSPWINGHVANEELLRNMEDALKRGVRIEIGYGIISEQQLEELKKKQEKSLNQKERDRNLTTELMAQKMQKRFSRYGADFKMFRIASHEKIFSYDDEYILFGSFNFLSYDGGEGDNYGGCHFRFEGGVMLKDPELVRKVKKEVFAFR